MSDITEKRICPDTQFETLQFSFKQFPSTKILVLNDGTSYNVRYDSTNTHLLLDTFGDKNMAEQRGRDIAGMICEAGQPLRFIRKLISNEEGSKEAIRRDWENEQYKQADLSN